MAIPWMPALSPQSAWIFCSAPEMTTVSKPKRNPASAEGSDKKKMRPFNRSGCWPASGALVMSVIDRSMILGQATSVGWPQVPLPFRRGNQRGFAFVCHWPSWFHPQLLGGSEFALVHVEREQLPRAQVQRRGDVENVEAAMPMGNCVARGKRLSAVKQVVEVARGKHGHAICQVCFKLV